MENSNSALMALNKMLLGDFKMDMTAFESDWSYCSGCIDGIRLIGTNS